MLLESIFGMPKPRSYRFTSLHNHLRLVHIAVLLDGIDIFNHAFGAVEPRWRSALSVSFLK